MPINIGREMALPMEQIIGGPLQAIIRAQSLAASATASFIEQVCLNSVTSGNPPNQTTTMTARTVDFSFSRQKPNADGTAVTAETVALTVPLLTIIPVPFIRIQQATIDFECTVSSS